MIRIDARGMRCPWPAIRLSRALREGAEAVEIFADDPNAPAEIAAAAQAAGAECRQSGDVSFPTFIVTARANRNGVFTLSR